MSNLGNVPSPSRRGGKCDAVAKQDGVAPRSSCNARLYKSPLAVAYGVFLSGLPVRLSHQALRSLATTEVAHRLSRFGAVGRHGSIAVVERFHRTLKEILSLITVPEHQPDFEHEVGLAIDWHNAHRPHETLDGKTPNEVYFSRPPANERPRIEPRPRWPRGSPCAKPQVLINGGADDPVIIEIDCLEGRHHLPIIRARQAACMSRHGYLPRYHWRDTPIRRPSSSRMPKINSLFAPFPNLVTLPDAR